MQQLREKIKTELKLAYLGEIADIKNGKSNTQDAIADGQYLFFDRSTLVKKSSKYIFDTEAVILPGEGAEFIPKYYKGKFDLHQRAYSIVPKADKINGVYLFYYLFLKRDFFAKKSVGSTVKSLRLPIIQSIPISFPTLESQEKIAKVLSKVDEDIEKTSKIIKQTEKLKRGLMQELFTKGIGHNKFKKIKLGEIPEEWDTKKLVDIATLQRGFDLPASKRIPGNYPLATSNGITDSHNDFQVEGPGVFTGRSGTIGKIFYVNENYWPLNTVLYIKDFHNNDKKFIYYFLQMIGLHNYQTGTGVPTLNRNVVHGIEFAIPKIIEQKKIAEILSKVDDKIDIYKTIKSKLEILKKGLMQDLLSA